MIRKIATSIISICLLIFLLMSGYQLELKLNEYRTALDISTERTLTTRKGRDVDFQKLLEQNEDVVGWIWLPDSNIDYPIVQGTDNDYYVHHDLDGSYLFDGCIFVDASVTQPFKDFNTVIYGHRMRSGAMFNHLGKFRDKDFFEKHKTIIIETPEQSYDLHVIAYCEELSDSDLYTTWFIDEDMPSEHVPEEYEDNYDTNDGLLTRKGFIELVRKTAKVMSDDEFDENDTFVTLSTCAFATGEERNQVIGVLEEAPKEENVTVVEAEKPFINKWLICQIAIGLIMLLAIVLTIISIIRNFGKENK